MIHQSTLAKSSNVLRAWKDGLSVKGISKATGLDRLTVRNLLVVSYGEDELKAEIQRRSRKTREASQKKDQAVRELIRRGHTQSAIASMLGVTRACISKRACRSEPAPGDQGGLQRMSDEALLQLIQHGDS